MKHLTLALLAFALPAVAETPMTADEFDAYATGRTLTFATQSGPYGVERYLPGRKVIWSFLGDPLARDCEEGEWYSEEIDGQTAICFVYDFDPTPQCWAMYEAGSGVRAEFLNEPGTTILYEAVEDQEALICGDFGV